jgi:hypothetical protein
MQSSFWKAGHPPALFAAFPYFDLSFVAPELLSGNAADAQSDLYAAGVTLSATCSRSTVPAAR